MKGKQYQLKCGAPTRRSNGTKSCKYLAGEGTDHLGYGHCMYHSKRSECEAWRLAQDIAREQQISPWEALLWGVRVSAGRLAWVELQLEDAIRRNELNGGEPDSPAVRSWLKESRLSLALMSRTSKAAIDAGIAAHVARQLEVEGRLLAGALDAALGALPELTADQRIAAISAAQQTLFSDSITDGS